MSAGRAPVSDDTLAKPTEVSAAYERWVARGGLAARTKTTYAGEVGQFCAWLADQQAHDPGDVFTDGHARDYAVRDYRRYLLTERKRAPKGVDLAMTSVKSLFGWLGLGDPTGVRQAAARNDAAPEALEEGQLRAVLRAAERRGPRDLALVGMGTYTGLRVSELAALDLLDVHLTARTGLVQVRSGKGDQPRDVPLNTPSRDLLGRWLADRPTWSAAQQQPALWLARDGKRLAVRSIRHVVAEVGKAAGVPDLHPHALRHTFATGLARAGVDVVQIADLMGHRDVNTARRYTRSTTQDRAMAVEVLGVDF